jgi:hypothetical protein
MSNLVTVKAAADRRLVSRRTLHRWIKEGALTKIGNKVRWEDVAELVARWSEQPRRGPRPGGVNLQVMFRANGFKLPKAQKRLSDLQRAEKVSEQLVRIREPRILELLAQQAFGIRLIREKERERGDWTKAKVLLARLRGETA